MATLSKRQYPNGTATWLVRYVDRNGVDRKQSLGRVDEVSEEEAREIFERQFGGSGRTVVKPLDTITTSSKSITKSESDYILKCYTELVKDIVKKHESSKRISKEEIIASGSDTAVIMLSDTHFGKCIPGIYDADKAKERVEEFTDRIIHLLSEHVVDVDEIVLAILGDIVDGWGIYPGQSFHVENSVPQQVFLAAQAVWAMIVKLNSAVRPKVFRVKAAPGNHGRVHKDAHIDTNWDTALYYTLKLLSTQYNETKSNDLASISVDFPEGLEYLNFEVKGHTVHMRHKAPSNTETPSGRAKFAGWLTKHNFDIMVYGDLHHFGLTDILGKMIIRNSSMFGDDDHSESMGLASKPGQFIFGVSENHAPSFIYPIFFKEEE